MCKNVVLSTCIFVLLVAAVRPAPGGINDGLVAFFKLDETEGRLRPTLPATATTPPCLERGCHGWRDAMPAP